MTTKQNNDQQYDDIEYAFFCDSLEKQYEQAKKDGLFEVYASRMNFRDFFKNSLAI